MAVLTVNSTQAAKDAGLDILEAQKEHGYVRVTIKKESRTDAQNRWINKAYEMLSKQGDMSIIDYRRECKYKFGMPILVESSPETEARWRKIVMCLSYEERRETMDDLNVTSTFDVEQGTRYIDEICKEYSGKQLPEKNWKERKSTYKG